MEGGTLSEDSFAQWSKNHVLFCHITTRLPGDKYPGLLARKGGRGFPFFAILDAKGNVIGNLSGQRTVEGFQVAVDGAQKTLDRFRGLEEKVAAGDATARQELFDLRFEMGHYTAAEAREAMKSLKLTDERRAELAGQIANIEVSEITATVRGGGPEARIRAGGELAKMFRAGRIPASSEQVEPFWVLLIEHAGAQKDVALFEKALSAMRAFLNERYPSNPRAGQYLDKCQKELDALKSGEKAPKKSESGKSESGAASGNG